MLEIKYLSVNGFHVSEEMMYGNVGIFQSVGMIIRISFIKKMTFLFNIHTFVFRLTNEMSIS